ncbi:MAG: sensor histidine kinase [Lachnospiraceae bacterium]|nr:sensor histidine kinase [Lachnospiraceae bacterium]
MPELRTGNLYFIAELLTAQFIFLYPAPKRRLFPLRLAIGLVLAVLAAGYFPSLPAGTPAAVSSLFRFLGMFLISYVLMLVLFDLKIGVIGAMCTAGYAVQHLSYRAAALVGMLPLWTGANFAPIGRNRFFEISVMLILYLVILLTFGRYSARNECWRRNDWRLHLIAVVTVFICVGINRLSTVFGEPRATVTGNIYGILCCLLALFIQFNLYRVNMALEEARSLELLRQEEKKQYEITKNTMDSINIKVHDLKHKLAAYRGSLPREELETLQKDINIYDSILKTGNDALDVLLAEKMAKCQARGIRMTVNGNCAPLSFMKTMDIYSLFGNAIDNAIEAEEHLPDEKRSIDVAVEERGDMVVLCFTNFFEGTLTMEDDLPATTKTSEPGYHGYGMKSMRLIAAKYAGELNVSARDDLFNLNVYLRRPAA